MQLKNRFSNMIPKIMEEFEYQKLSISDNLEFFKPTYTRKQKTFAEEISASLNMKPKKINPKYLYDDYGSKLFEDICLLSEYYPFESEKSILKSVFQEFNPLKQHFQLLLIFFEKGSRVEIIAHMRVHKN